MLFLAFGLGLLVLLIAAARGFANARVSTIRTLLNWIAALAGLSLAALLLLTGRGGIALFALTLVGPLVWERLRGLVPPGLATGSRPQSRPQSGPMTVEDAYAVLGLSAGASESEIRAAHLRLMRNAHPDNGGSDWLASRINQARDVLLAKPRASRS